MNGAFTWTLLYWLAFTCTPCHLRQPVMSSFRCCAALTVRWCGDRVSHANQTCLDRARQPFAWQACLHLLPWPPCAATPPPVSSSLYCHPAPGISYAFHAVWTLSSCLVCCLHPLPCLPPSPQSHCGVPTAVHTQTLTAALTMLVRTTYVCNTLSAIEGLLRQDEILPCMAVDWWPRGSTDGVLL